MTAHHHTRLFIGVDGGQSSTLTILVNEHGEILASTLTGPCNHVHEPGGSERQYNALRSGYEQVLAKIGLGVTPVEGVHLGLTGSGNMDIVSTVYETEHIGLTNDAVTALAGAIPENIGVVVISGTGAISFGRNAAGEEAWAGGHGYFAGDEGSGYDIGRMGIQAIFQASDGRNPETLLTDLILNLYNCANLQELHYKIYSGVLSRDQLARAAGMVGKAGAEGDPVAIRILANAGHELGRTVAAVLEKLGLVNDPTPVAAIGGVFNAGALITTSMLARIHQTNPQAYLIKPRFIPAVGAALLALRRAGVAVNEALLANLKRTQDRLVVSSTGDKFQTG